MSTVAFQLERTPFADRPDPAFFFESKEHSRAFEALQKEANGSHPLIVLTGRPGAGKTLLASCLIRKAPQSDSYYLIRCPANFSGRWSSLVAEELGVADRPGDQIQSLQAIIAALPMAPRAGAASKVVLIFDQAERLSDKDLDSVVQMLDESSAVARVRLRVIWLDSRRDPLTIERIVSGRVSVSFAGELSALRTTEIESYLRHRWMIAGGSDQLPFTRQATRSIARHAGGNPRRLNRLCDALLVRAAKSGWAEIDEAQVRDVVSRGRIERNQPTSQDENRATGSTQMFQTAHGPESEVAAKPGMAVSVAQHSKPREIDISTALSAERTLELVGLIQRLESAVERAPRAVRAIDEATSLSGTMLSKLESHHSAIERQHGCISRSLSGLENTCQRAEGVQSELQSFVRQLEEIGVSSQEKISILLESLEVSQKTRDELDDVSRGVSDAVKRMAETTAENERRLSASVEALNETQRRKHQESLDRLEHTIREKLAPFEERGEHAARLAEMITRGIASIRTSADESRRLTEETISGLTARMQSAAAQQESRIAERIEQSLQRSLNVLGGQREEFAKEIRRLKDEFSADGELALHLRARIESDVEDSHRRMKESTDACAKRIELRSEQFDAARREQLQKELADACAEQLERLSATANAHARDLSQQVESAEQKIQSLCGRVKEVDRIFDKVIQGRDDVFDRKLAEVASEAADRTMAIVDGRCEAIKSEVDRRLAPFAPSGEQTAHLTEIITRGVATIRTVAQESQNELPASIQRFKKQCESELADVQSRLSEVTDAVADDSAARAVTLVLVKRNEIMAELNALISTLEPDGEVSAGIRKKIENGLRQIEKTAEDSVAAIRKEVDPAIEHVSAAVEESGERSKAILDQAVHSGVGAIETLFEQCTARLDQTSQQYARRFISTSDNQTRQLASQLQAGKESVRQLSDATQTGHKVLAALTEKCEVADAGIKKIESIHSSSDQQALRLEELTEEADGRLTRLVECLDGTGERIERIERTLQDARDTATATAQRTRELQTCAENASGVIDRLRDIRRESDSLADAMADHQEAIRRSSEEVEGAIRRSDDSTTRLEEACRRADESSTRVTAAKGDAETVINQLNQGITRIDAAIGQADGAIQRAGGAADKLDALNARSDKVIENQEVAITRCEEVISRVDMVATAAGELGQRVNEAVDRARGCVQSLQDHAKHGTESIGIMRKMYGKLKGQVVTAQQTAQRLDGCIEQHVGTLEQIEKWVETGDEIGAATQDALEKSGEIQRGLSGATEKAESVCREVSDLLAAITQRRDDFDANEKALNYCIERADAVRVKLQQLQTRGDAFEHQLNGMLTEPQKIVEEAKTQADQLGLVCGAVRKVFSALSRTSLQANRDVSKFAEISREANGRLSQLKSESERVSQTLREWIDEAAHAQARLSKSLSRVPPISRTHPTQALQDLALASRSGDQEVHPAPSSTRMGSPERRPMPQTPSLSERRVRPEDLAELIQEAEDVADTMHGS